MVNVFLLSIFMILHDYTLKTTIWIFFSEMLFNGKYRREKPIESVR